MGLMGSKSVDRRRFAGRKDSTMANKKRSEELLAAIDRANEANDVLFTVLSLVGGSSEAIDAEALSGLFSILLNVHEANEALLGLL